MGTTETPPPFGLSPTGERPSINLPAIPPETRGASSLSEAFTRGTPEQRKALLAAKSLGLSDLIFEPSKFESLAPGATFGRTSASGGFEPLYKAEDRPARPTRPTDFQTVLDAVSQSAGFEDYASVPADQKQSIVQKARAAQQAPERPGEEEHRRASTKEIEARTRRVNEAINAAKDPKITQEKLTTIYHGLLRDRKETFDEDKLIEIETIIDAVRKRLAAIIRGQGGPLVMNPSSPGKPKTGKTPVPGLPGWSFEGQ
jgi:hypothetical protein